MATPFLSETSSAPILTTPTASSPYSRNGDTIWELFYWIAFIVLFIVGIVVLRWLGMPSPLAVFVALLLALMLPLYFAPASVLMPVVNIISLLSSAALIGFGLAIGFYLILSLNAADVHDVEEARHSALAVVP